MAGLTPYTTTEAVRGALGVSAVEIPDVRMLDRSLDVETLLWMQKLGVDYELVKSTADANPNDATAQADYKRLCLGTMYAAAAIAAESPVQFMQSIGDGKNQAKRFDGVDWAELSRQLRGKAREMLTGISTYVAPAGTTLSLMGRASPTYDPVTNT